MRPVRVSKTALLDTIQRNRDEHHAIFIEALDGYRAAAIAAFEEQIERAKAGKGRRYYVALTEPDDHTADYDSAIGMLTLSLDEEVELDQESYTTLVENRWRWMAAFYASNSGYSKTAAKMAERDE